MKMTTLSKTKTNHSDKLSKTQTSKDNKLKKRKLLPDYLRKIATAVAIVYLTTTTMGCASFYVNGAKVYDPDIKQNQKIYAASGTEGTDANIGENVPWYKTKLGIIGISAVLIIFGGFLGYAIYDNNHDDPAPAYHHHHHSTPPPVNN